MAKQEGISFMQFKQKFDSEEACRDHLFKMRWPHGFCCPKCGSLTHYEIPTRNLMECADCHYQASVTVGTIMEKTHLALEKWFWGIYFFGIDKRGCSAMLLAKELEISYKSAWFMLHRIRKAMKDRDSQYLLDGLVEMDDAYFGAKKEGSKRGRGTDKAKIVVGLSINDQGHPQYLKMEVVHDLKRQTLADFANAHIASGSTISSDAYRSYLNLQKEGYQLEAKVFNPKADSEHLKWLHTIISNAKAFVEGTFHGLDKKYLQSYLDEFCYRFNRRFFPSELFNRILISCISSHRILFTELTT